MSADVPLHPLYMPLIGTPLAIQFAVLDLEQAQQNHGQSLTRLAQRGGLAPFEALALVKRDRLRLHVGMPPADALKALATSDHQMRAYGDARAAAAVQAERERCASFCEEACLQIGCTASEAEGVVRRTRDALATGIRRGETT
jgi:hypothetical protein